MTSVRLELGKDAVMMVTGAPYLTARPCAVATWIASLARMLRLLLYLAMVTVAANMPDTEDQKQTGMWQFSRIHNCPGHIMLFSIGAYLGGPLGVKKCVLMFSVKNMLKCEQFLKIYT